MMSGLAAGVLGGAWMGQRCGRDRVITFDIGGTSADIGIAVDGVCAETDARSTSIAGFPHLMPMLDIHTIGAGGGSIAYVDQGGAFKVGPQSAGAEGHAFKPWGFDGGADGYVAKLTLVHTDGTSTSLPSKGPYFKVKAGEKLVSVGPSGGGYGDPRRRPADALAADIADGLLTKETSNAIFGKAVSPPSNDRVSRHT